MHRIKYTKLTKEQIDEKLKKAESGPDSFSELSEILAGKSINIITDNGLIINYKFNNKNNLSLAFDDQKAVDCGYGALTLKDIAFFSHMIPGTQKGYNVVIDQKTNLATVIEVWFSGYKDNREVQRKIYYGYMEEKGKQAPEKRHHLTNRLEGKGFFWKMDRGIETLEFYPSIMYSSFVELTRRGGELTFCGPSDFIQIDENIFLYDRIECEFSGTMTMYVLDLFTVKQIGMRLGFDEHDALEYYMFRGEGEVTGQIAKFERFDDHGKKIDFDESRSRVYRPLSMHPPMTEEEVHNAVTKNMNIFGSGGIMDTTMSGNKMPLSDCLAGREFTLRYDDNGPVWNYKVDEMKKLKWRQEGDSKWKEELYQAFEPAEAMIMFSHIHSGTRPNESVTVALDFLNGLTTCVYSKLGTEYMGNEVSQKIIFGIIEAGGIKAPKYWRHKFTDELVGRSYIWNYSDDMSSIHVYSTPQSYSWTIFLNNQSGGMMWSSPCRYMKLRGDTYMFTWVEEACNGGQGTVLFNTRTMHDCGFFYSVSREGLNMGTMGAFARMGGYYDIKKYFGLKAGSVLNASL